MLERAAVSGDFGSESASKALPYIPMSGVGTAFDTGVWRHSDAGAFRAAFCPDQRGSRSSEASSEPIYQGGAPFLKPPFLAM